MSIMMAQMSLSVASGLGNFGIARTQAKMQERIQAFSNTMNELSAARQKNAVTVNEIRTRDEATRRDALIETTALQDQGAARVVAAAAGVKGNSVDAVMRDLKASAGRASYANLRQKNEAMAEFSEQRRTISLNAIAGTGVQVIPKPSVGSMLLGVGTNLLSIYDSHQPTGSKLLE